MKAIVSTRYGLPDVLEFKDIPTPAPADNEVLIKVFAASVNPLDSYAIRGPLFFLPKISRLLKPKPKVIGADVAGRVEALGRLVTQFQPGDEVMGCKNVGAFAEYVCIPEGKVGLKPANLSFEQTAAVPIAAITALQGLRDKGEIQKGQRVLIDGASGGVGTFAIQIASAFGADVTAVCSTRNLDTARSLGANHVIDYSQEDFAQNGQQYDLILAANAHHSIFAYKRTLTRNGTFVLVGGAMSRMLQGMLMMPLLTRLGSKKMRFFIANMNTKDLTFLKDLLEAGKIVSVIDRTFPLSKTVEALNYREEGHARGKVIITVNHEHEL